MGGGASECVPRASAGFGELAWPLAHLDSGVRGGTVASALDRRGDSVGPISPEAFVVVTTLSKIDQKLFQV